MAGVCDRSVSLVADDEDACGGFYDVVCDCFEVVDFEDAVDLWEEAFQQPEVAPGDAFDRCDGLSVGEVVWVKVSAEVFPVSLEDEE